MSDPLVLVTGSSGYVGSHVTKLLQCEGYRVRGTVRSLKNEAKVKFLYDLVPDAKHKLELVEADLTNEECWLEAVKDCEIVHHVASPFPLEIPKTEDELITPAVNGTLFVLRACAKSGSVKKVIVTSSMAAISQLNETNTVPYTEKDWASTENYTAYGKSKVLAEKAAWDFVKDLPDDQKFELATINPGLVLGVALHTSEGSSISVIKRFLERDTPMVPKLNMNIVSVENVALAHLKAQTVPEAAGNRHLLLDGSMWFSEIGKVLLKEFGPQGYKVPVSEIPHFLFTVATFFHKDARMLKNMEGKKPTFDNSRMINVLGIQPKNMEAVIIDMAYSLIEGGFIKKTKKYTGRTNV